MEKWLKRAATVKKQAQAIIRHATNKGTSTDSDTSSTSTSKEQPSTSRAVQKPPSKTQLEGSDTEHEPPVKKKKEKPNTDIASSDRTEEITEVELESEEETPAKKKQLAKKDKFNDKWLLEPEFKYWLKKSHIVKNESELAICSACNSNLRPHRSDLIRHMKSECHKSCMKQVAMSSKVTDFMQTSTNNKVKRAELKLTSLLATNNLPFTLMDTLGSLCADIFPDSEIAKCLSIHRTKSTTIMKNVLGNAFANETVDLIKEPGHFFSLVMDETTDHSSKKQCAFTVIVFNNDTKKVSTHFFDMVEVSSSTATALFDCLLELLNAKGVPLDNLIGFSSDTTNVMVGEHNSVFAKLKQVLPHIACIKCSCHMINLSASKACLKLPRSVEDLLRNIGSHFSRSSHRQQKFKEFQEFFQVQFHKMLTLSQTRWLSMKACVDRVLEQYEPLKAYLRLSTFEDPSRTTEEMLKTMDNKFTIVYLEFMSYILEILTTFNVMFQSEAPLLHKLKPEVERMLKSICSNYFQISYVRSQSSNIFLTNFQDSSNFLPLREIYLGMTANESTTNLLKDRTISNTDMETFYKSCLAFYIELAVDIVRRFDFSDPLFKLISVVEPSEAQAFKIKSLSGVFIRFPILKNYVDLQSVDNEWREHALLEFNSLGLESLPTEEYWPKVFNLKNAAGMPLFKNLEKAIGLLLILPFSNASVERVFSNLNNIKTQHRGSLNNDTIAALMHTKQGIAKAGNLLKFEPNRSMINAKTWQKYNN